MLEVKKIWKEKIPKEDEEWWFWVVGTVYTERCHKSQPLSHSAVFVQGRGGITHYISQFPLGEST